MDDKVHVNLGDLVYVQYRDIGFFRDKNNPSNCCLADPFIMEVVGWVVDKGESYNLIFEWAYGKWNNEIKERRPHGNFAIPKNNIIEMRKLDSNSFKRQFSVWPRRRSSK